MCSNMLTLYQQLSKRIIRSQLDEDIKVDHLDLYDPQPCCSHVGGRNTALTSSVLPSPVAPADICLLYRVAAGAEKAFGNFDKHSNEEGCTLATHEENQI